MYTRKMIPITERASELIPCIFGVFKNKIEGGGGGVGTEQKQ